MDSSGSSPSTSSTFFYSCIAHKSTILAEHTATPSSAASSLASVILPKITHTEPSQRASYTHAENLINYIADGPADAQQSGASSGSNGSTPNAPGLTFLCIVRKDVGQKPPFAYLAEIRRRFLGTYTPDRTDFGSLPPYGCAAFNAHLKNIMGTYASGQATGGSDAFGRAQREIDEAKGVMTQNIERVLERGEHMNLLVDKTDRLGGSAREFRYRSKGLRRRMWWKDVRLMVLLGLVVVFLIYLFVGFGCGLPGWSRCVGHSNKGKKD